ncbi:MAG: peptidoglycan bridge formation glycyltransferase FemA/FemB family protein [Anaerolineaceae bacterium]|nr:peptidoglycan bridge formation glycyltransferase FemA/FemB family protein [Anaerolineaceae bacterium]
MAFEIYHPSTGAGWNTMLASLPEAHILQTWEWAETKEQHGWKKIPLVWRNNGGEVCAAAMVLLRSEPRLNIKILYIPRGPVLDWEDKSLREVVLSDLTRFAVSQKAIFIKIDAEIQLGSGEPGRPESEEDINGLQVINWLLEHGWRRSEEQIQFANTIWMDVTGSEGEILARMKQKTRYNVRVAQKKGVQVRLGGMDDFSILYKMYVETSVRDGFVIRSWEYYQRLWRKFYEAGMMDMLIAEVKGKAVAGLLLFHFAGRSWYLYGMSTQEHREKMPNYMLQWEALKLSAVRGCSVYDMWGAPSDFCETDPLWNVYRFKEGFGGRVVRTAGAWDFPVSRWRYALYIKILPAILNLMRVRGKKQTQQEAAL